MKVDREKCLRCSGCVGVCPVACIELLETGIQFGPECTNCSSCVKFCPVGAISNE